jgi:hypothetical protein
MTTENDAIVRELQVSIMRLTEMLDRMRQERDYYRSLADSLYVAGTANTSGSPSALAAWSQVAELYMQDYV